MCLLHHSIANTNKAYLPPDSIPSLSELGYEEFEVHKDSAFKFLGGETHGIDRVNEYFFESKNLSKYKLTRNGLVGKDYSSKISS